MQKHYTSNGRIKTDLESEDLIVIIFIWKNVNSERNEKT